MYTLKYEDIKTIAELHYDWDKLREKTMFISGGTGFIGGFIIDVLRYRNRYFDNKINIIVCSRNKDGINDNITYIKHDITQPIIQRLPHIDYIIHLASNTHPKQYSNDPIGTIITNVYGSYNLLNLAKENRVRLLLASSVEIYGDGNGIPMTEEYCGYIDCNTVRAGYNESKRVSESLCQSFISQFGIDCVIARLARVFGPDTKKDSKAMAQFIDCAVKGKDIVLKSKGEQRFSFLYVADAVSGIIKLLLDGECGEAYNIAADDENMTLGGYAEFISNLVGRKIIYDFVGVPGSSKSTYAIIDCNKIKKLGWTPIYSVSEGLRRTVEILKDVRL